MLSDTVGLLAEKFWDAQVFSGLLVEQLWDAQMLSGTIGQYLSNFGLSRRVGSKIWMHFCADCD